MSGVWVFGYGSLVSPASFGHTLGRAPRPGTDFFEAEVAGYGRRWNYALMHSVGETIGDRHPDQTWTIVALGVVESQHETVNGIVAWVEEHELVALDRRESQYDRVEVTASATVHHGGELDGPVVTYVPRREPQALYEWARDRGRAAVEQRYWDLVDGAFADLGEDRRKRYHATTPPPDIPIVPMERHLVADRDRVRDLD